jgi:DNA-binding CsgD family transcriptional regulator/tetratricopeptide (TPR) repeat protein
VARTLVPLNSDRSFTSGGSALRGRESERAVLERLLDEARDGHSGAIVLRGEAGIGKTALLEYVVEAASDFRVVRSGGVEAELELAFAGVHQLCAPLLEGLDRLPAPQQHALRAAFGLAADGAPEKFFVGLAVLGLLSVAAHDRPLLCLVDDAHWLDDVSAESLAFVARRLHAESVVLLFATRTETDDQLAGIPTMLVPPLPDTDARDLLASVIRGPLDERIRERVLAEAEGNPLALIELPRGSSPASLAGGLAVPPGSPLAARIEASFAERLSRLPEETQRLLWLAAAEPLGDPSLLWHAASVLGIPATAAGPAEADNLLEIGIRVRFRHPLVRSAAYRAAPPVGRREMHRALSECIDAGVDPDRRSWHRAEALTEPDEDVAGELERAADRAQARAGAAAAAAFMERSARVTPDPSRRASRALSAAEMELDAGSPDAAVALLSLTETPALDRRDLARRERLRAMVAFVQRRAQDAPRLMVEAAKRLESVDPALALKTYLDALQAVLTIAEAGQRDTMSEITAALATIERTAPPTPTEMLVLAQAQLILGGKRTDMADAVQKALAEFDEGRAFAPAEEIRGVLFGFIHALSLMDDEGCTSLGARGVKIGRDAGALTALPIALEFQATIRIFTGDFEAAQRDIEEAGELAVATGSIMDSDSLALLAAWKEPRRVGTKTIESIIAKARSRGEASPFPEFAAALMHNACGRYDRAIDAALQSIEQHVRGGSSLVQPELIEAAVRVGRQDLAERALQRLIELLEPASGNWAAGVEARSRALLADSASDAEALYQLAIRRLEKTRIRTDLARTRLLYGEWLRRERRRTDARQQLQAAHESFRAMGARSFAERASRELLAAGGRAAVARGTSRTQLTAQEAQIARLAREGLSNSAIGSQLFISPRTVEYHLHKVFSKLEIASRGELVNALPDELQRVQA